MPLGTAGGCWARRDTISNANSYSIVSGVSVVPVVVYRYRSLSSLPPPSPSPSSSSPSSPLFVLCFRSSYCRTTDSSEFADGRSWIRSSFHVDLWHTAPANWPLFDAFRAFCNRLRNDAFVSNKFKQSAPSLVFRESCQRTNPDPAVRDRRLL